MSLTKRISSVVSGVDAASSVINSVLGTGSDLPSIQIALDGKPLYMYNFRCALSMARDSEDMSGQQSGTQRTDKGIKAKKLSVYGTIPYGRQEWIAALMELAQAVDDKGAQRAFRVSNRTADAAGMRECEFTGDLSIEEAANAWEISFELSEKNSVAEKKQKQAKKPKAKKQSETSAVSSRGAAKTAEQSAPVAESDDAQQEEYDSALGQIFG